LISTPISNQLERLLKVSDKLSEEGNVDALCKVTDKIVDLTRELNQKRLLSKEEAIQYTGFTQTAFDNLVRDKKIKCVRPSGHKGKSYFSVKALEEYIQQQEMQSIIIQDIEKLAPTGSYVPVT